MGDPGQLAAAVCRLPGTRPGIDVAAARRQWSDLREALGVAGAQVHTLPPATPTTCFVRDAVLTRTTARGPAFVQARLDGPRVTDPSHVGGWLRGHGVGRVLWTAVGRVAGGDLVWGGGCLLAGRGRASMPVAARAIAQSLGAPALPLALVDARWPTLDQAVCPLDAGRALWVPEAFDDAGAATLGALFSRLEPVEFPSAVRVGDRVILDAGAVQSRAAVEDLGLEPVMVELGAWRNVDAGPAALVCPLS